MKFPTGTTAVLVNGKHVPLAEYLASVARSERGEGAAVPATPSRADVRAQTEPVAESAEIDATDSAKALAREHGIDLAAVAGTGANGRILKSDVEKAIS